MKTYRLTSVKGNRTVQGSRDDAIAAAKKMEADLGPAFGVSVEDERGRTVAEVRDGRVCRD